MTRLTVVALCLFIVAGSVYPAWAGEKFITIGTAGEHGVYYPAGGAICRLVKRGIKEHGIHCFVEATSGSVHNLKALREGELDLALSQSDQLYHAYHGTREFADAGPDTSLRALFSLHTEAFTVLAREGAGITKTKDLLGKTIGLGNDGSGMQATAEEFLKAEGWSRNSFHAVIELKPAELQDALCSGKVDAVLSMSGHPNGIMEEITHKCATRLIAIEGPEIDKLVKDNPYYLRVTIPGGMYPGTPAPVNTFGVKAVLVTSNKVDADIIYQVVKAVFDNLDNFKTLHPVFSTLDKTRMKSEGLVVPLDAGAIRYFKETGLTK